MTPLDEYKMDIRIYWEDTDAGGVVYHSNYLNFAERARTEWLRSVGIPSQKEYQQQSGVNWVVKSITVEYLSPAFLDDIVTVACDNFHIKGASINMRQTILRGDTILCVVQSKVVTINTSGRPVRVPEFLTEKQTIT